MVDQLTLLELNLHGDARFEPSARCLLGSGDGDTDDGADDQEGAEAAEEEGGRLRWVLVAAALAVALAALAHYLWSGDDEFEELADLDQG